jgi:hypothetical protein
MPKIKLDIDSDVFDKLKQISADAGYSSLEEYLHHLLEKEITSIEDPGSEEELKRRLKGLGYIS